MSKLNILVIATGNPDRLLSTIKERGHGYTLTEPKDFDIYLSDSVKGFDTLYLRGEKFNASSYDAVISRIGAQRDFATKILHQLQHNMKVFCVQSGESINICADKLTTAQIMSENRIKVPKQFHSCNPASAKMMIERLGGLPVILKELSGSKGKGIILLESPLQTNMTLQSYLGGDRKVILQKYLQNGNIDERHIVCGGKVVNSMQRIAPRDDVRANLSQKGTAKPIQADPETEEMCIKAVAAIKGLNFAGVDVMKVKDETGKATNYLIEVNSNPGEKIIEITGHNHYNDLLDFIEKSIGTNHQPGPTMPKPEPKPEIKQPVTTKQDLKPIPESVRKDDDEDFGWPFRWLN